MMNEVITFIQDDSLLKLSFAACAGLLIGFERELKGKPLGLKTYLVISVTACLLTIVAFEAAAIYAEAYVRPMDVGRIPSYIISGVGFIGAGVILRRNNDAISGLTTASLVLASAGLGITIGVGFYIEAAFGIFFIFLSVRIIPKLISLYGPRQLKDLKVRTKMTVSHMTDLTNLVKKLNEHSFRIHRLKITEEEKVTILSCYLFTNEKLYTTDIFTTLKKIEDIIHVEVENLN